MNSRIITITLLFYLLSASLNTFTQIDTFYVTEQDTTIITDWTKVEDKSSIYNFYDFVNKLPQGYYYGIIRGDTMMEGYFNEDSLREGAFKYYLTNSCYTGNFLWRKRRKYKALISKYNFKNGKLHGYCFEKFTNNTFIEQGYYNMGKKDGLFLYYDYYGYENDNGVTRIERYKNDTLIYCTRYPYVTSPDSCNKCKCPPPNWYESQGIKK